MPHIHMKIWVKNAPVYGVDSEEDVIAFIDKHISVQRYTADDELNELIEKFQIHGCTSSCNRTVYNFEICRYGFPKEESIETVLNNPNTVGSSIKKSNF